MTVHVVFMLFFGPPLLAATPGLPFTEDFTTGDLADTNSTTANWSTDAQRVRLAWRHAWYGVFAGGAGSGISADAQLSPAVALGDVDGDGDLDVVVGVESEANRLYLNNGTSDPFNGVSGSDIGTETNRTLSIALGDADGDGDLDVVAGNHGYEANLLYLNNGTASPFQDVQGREITGDTNKTTGIALGDMDGDGDLDVVAANQSERARLYLNNGTPDPFAGVVGSDITTDAHNTRGMALGDINGDGYLDFVRANDGQVNRLYTNNGTASPFAGVVGTSFGAEADATYGVALGDMNGDGRLDILEANYDQTNRVYFGQGEGAFGDGVGITTNAESTWALSVSDVDGDGDLDVVAANYNQNSRLYLNVGAPDWFVEGQAFDLSASTRGLAMGDLDGDGAADLVVARYYGSQPNRVYLNGAKRNPYALAQGTNLTADAHDSYAVATGDMDGDGDLDVVVANGSENVLYLNNGTLDPFVGIDGTNVTSDFDSTRAVAVGDVDGDGDLDVVAANDSSTANRLYLNNGTDDPFSGIDGTNITSDADDTYAIVLGDVDGDGDLDVVVGNSYSENKLYLNNGTSDPFNGIAGSNITADTDGTYAIALGDVDGDGDLDVVAGNDSYNKYYLNNGTADPFLDAAGTNVTDDSYNTYGLVLADMNGDGALDVVAGNYMAEAYVYYNTGGTDPFDSVMGVAIAESDSPYTYGLAVGDVDGDGDLDVVRGTDMDNQVHLQNADGTFTAGFAITASENNTEDVALADMDGDGDLDVVAVNNSTTANRLYLNGSVPPPMMGWVGEPLTIDTDNSLAVALGDLDNDGDLDVVVGNDSGRENVLYLNNGTRRPFDGVDGTNITSDAHDTRALALGDVDGDGDLDVIAGNVYGQKSRLYLNNGTSDPFNGVTGQDVSSDTYTVFALVLGDVDRDGDLDLIAGSNSGEPTRLYFGDGAGSFSNGVNVSSDTYETHGIFLGDVDSDGDLDLLCANNWNNGRVYLNNGDGTFDAGSDIDSDGGYSYSMAVGDVDGDGDLDVVTGEQSATNRLYVGVGDGTFSNGVNISLDEHTTYGIALADIDCDGDLDVLTADEGTTNRVYLNHGDGTFEEGINLTEDEAYSQALAVADLDGDGLPDVVVANGSASENKIYRRVLWDTARGKVTSLTIDTESGDIPYACLTAAVDMPTNAAVAFRLSNDGGGTWCHTVPGKWCRFPGPGSDLRWGAELSSLSPAASPSLLQIEVEGDPLVAEFDAPSSAGDESLMQAWLSVSLSGSTNVMVTVDYMLTGGSASNGVDYLLSDGSITFDPGVTTTDVVVQVMNDGMPEPDETVEVSLVSCSHGVVGTNDVHTYTIVNDDAPWEFGYSFRKKIRIWADVVSGAADLRDFPALIEVTDPDLRTVAKGGHVEHSQGFDVMFTAADGTTRLDFERESWTGTAGDFIGWVRIPVLACAEDTFVYVYYGNASITSSQEDAAGVWGGDYAGVWHMNESPADPTPQIADSTRHVNDGTCEGGMDAFDLVMGQIHNSLDFDGADDRVNAGKDGSLSDLTQFTLSAWVIPDVNDATDRFLFEKQGWALFVNSGVLCFTQAFNAAAGHWQSGGSVPVGAWHHVAVAYDHTSLANDPVFYIDGVTQAVTEVATPDGLVTQDTLFDAMIASASGVSFDGRMDEVRLEKVVRSQDWMATAFTNQCAPGSFCNWGAEETHMLTVQFVTPAVEDLESEPAADIGVALSLTPGVMVTVDYSVAGGTAASGLDYVLAAGTLTFWPGETGTNIALTILDDFDPEPDETITVALANAVNAELAAPSNHTFTILDDDAPWLAGYGYRKALELDSEQVGGESDLTNFPLLVNVTDTNLRAVVNGGRVEHMLGYDVVFTTADGTNVLDHERERYLGSSGLYVGWVRVPVLACETDTVLYMYYGNPAVTGSQENAAAVWDADYAGVWHLAQNPAGAAPQFLDSSANTNHGTAAGTSNLTLTASHIGLGLDFPGTNAWIDVATSNFVNALDITGTQLTMEAWARVPVAGVDNDEALLVKGDGSHNLRYMLGVVGNAAQTNDAAHARLNYNTNGVSFVRLDAHNVYPRNAWIYEAATYDGAELVVYVNGARVGSAAFSADITSGTDDIFCMGRRIEDERYFEGVLDDVRLSSTARSEGWLATCYANAAMPGAFLEFGLEQIGPPTLDFASAASARLESEAAPSVAITFYPETARTGTVDLVVTGGTAGMPADYADPAQTLTFLPGTVSTNFVLAIEGDPNQEPNETIVLSLTNVVDGELGTVTVHTYTIVDDDAPWRLGYTYRKAVALGGGVVGGATDLTNFPALVSLTDADLRPAADGGKLETPSGYDILFTDASGTNGLAHEVERYEPGVGRLVSWVRVPVLSTQSDTALYLYYGNRTVKDSLEDPASVWADYAAVWHLADDGGLQPDSSGNDRIGLVKGDPAFVANGRIGPCLNFDGAGDFLSVSNLSYNSVGQITEIMVSAWVKGAMEGGQIIASWDDSEYWRFELESAYGAGNVGWITDMNGGAEDALTTAADYTDGVWHYVCGWFKNGETPDKYIFVDGAAVTSSTAGVAIGSGVTRYGFVGIGSEASVFDGPTGPSNQLNGMLDELRICDMARGPEWIAACYTNQAGPDAFCEIGLEQTGPVTAQFEAPESAGSETETDPWLGVYLNLASVGTVVIDYAVVGGTASNGLDYVLSDGTLTFEPGETELALPMVVVDDLYEEDDETVIVSLTGAVNAELGPQATHSYTIEESHGADPAEMAGLQLWYKADALSGCADGEPVGTWPDSSGFGRGAWSTTVSVFPVYKTGIFGGGPALRFDGVNDRLNVPKISDTFYDGVSLFVVAAASSSAGIAKDGFVLDNNQGDADSAHYFVFPRLYFSAGYAEAAVNGQAQPVTLPGDPSGLHVWCMEAQEGGAFRAYKDGVSGTESSVSVFSSYLDYFGKVGCGADDLTTRSLAADYAEILAYDRMLSNDERWAIEAYLNRKYNAYATPPDVVTGEATGVGATGATLAGTVLFDGNTNLLVRGFVCDTNPAPADIYVAPGTETGPYTYAWGDGIPGTRYYAAAFASNALGTTFGETVSFDTEESFLPAYACRRLITIDPTRVGGGADLIDFPVLVSLTEPDLASTGNGGHVEHTNGYDIVFAAADGATGLDHEVELYNCTNGTYTAWVRVPVLAYDRATHLFLYYGNAAVTESQENATNVWDTHYVGVWHLNEDPQVEASQIGDSSRYANDGTAAGYESDDSVAGIVTYAFESDEDAEYVDVASAGVLDDITNLTVEAWVKPIVLDGTSRRVWSKGTTIRRLYQSWGDLWFDQGFVTGAHQWRLTSGALTVGAWQQVAVTYDSTSDANDAVLYLDGSPGGVSRDMSGMDGMQSDAAQVLTISGTGTDAWNGGIDELRVSDVIRSDGWIATGYTNVVDPAGFAAVGPEQSRTVGFTEEKSSGSESATPAVLEVRLSSASSLEVCVDYAVAGGSATDGVDYTLVAGTLTFAAGQTATNIEIAVAGDGDPEPDETVDLLLSNATNATLATAEQVYTIVDDDAGWLPGYACRRKVVLNAGLVSGTSPLTDFPFLLVLQDWSLRAAMNGGNLESLEGYDAVFTAYDGVSRLDHETELYDEPNGAITAWVRIPSLHHEYDTVLYLYYGNPYIEESQENTTNVWDVNHVGVWHLTCSPDDPEPSAPDSSAWANDGTCVGLTDADERPGRIAGGLRFWGTNSTTRIDAGSDSELDDITNLTFSAWCLAEDLDNIGGLFAKGGKRMLYLRNGDSTGFAESRHYWDPGADLLGWRTEAGSLQIGQWLHIVYQYDSTSTGNDAVYYVNGETQAVTEAWGPDGGTAHQSDAADVLRIGRGELSWINSFDGILDEVRVSDVLRSADWIKTGYSNQSDPASAARLEEESAPPRVEFAFGTGGGMAGGGGEDGLSDDESVTNNTLEVALSWATNVTVTVDYIVSGGTATGGGADHAIENGTLTFDPGQTSAELAVLVVDDDLIEEDETIEITLTNAVGAVLWHNATATYTIVDDEDSWKSGWRHRREIGVHADAVAGTGSLTNFPILVSVTNPSLMSVDFGGRVESTNGYDIVFTASDGETLLDFELETYAPSNGQVIAWVRLPVLRGDADTGFWMYYGNPDVAVSQANATGVWDGDFKAVLHLYHDPIGTIGDSTANANDYTAMGTMTSNDAAAQVGTGVYFDGSDDFIYPTDSHANPNPFTLELWFKTDTTSGGQLIVLGDTKKSASATIGRHIWLDNPGNLYFGVQYGSQYVLTNANTHNDNAWHYAAARLSSKGQFLFADGSVVASNETVTTANNFTGFWRVGYDKSTGWTPIPSSDYFRGSVDEVRVSHTERSDEWIATCYTNQASPSDFCSAGVEQNEWDDVTRPDEIDGLQLWYKADALAGFGDGDAVGTWLDSSGYGRAAWCTSYSRCPLYKSTAWNGLPGLSFDGVDDKLSVPKMPDTFHDAASVFLLMESYTALNDRSALELNCDTGDVDAHHYFGFWIYGSGADPRISARGGSLTTVQLNNHSPFGLHLWYLENEELSLLKLYKDGVLGTETGSDTFDNRYYYDGKIGCSGQFNDSYFAQADFAEIIAYNRCLTDDDRQDVELYLNRKYNIWQDFPRVETEDLTDIGPTNATFHGDLRWNGNTNLVEMGFMCDEEPNPSTRYTVQNMGEVSFDFPWTGGAPATRYYVCAYAQNLLGTSYGRTIAFLTPGTPFYPGCVYRKLLTAHGSTIQGDLSDFPFLVDVTDADLRTVSEGGKVRHGQGYDIVLTADDGLSKLDHEVEAYDPVEGHFTAWVRIPVLEAGQDTLLFLYYGDPTVSAPQENPAGVWDTAYVGVWHMGEDPTGAAPQMPDSTAYGNDGTCSPTFGVLDEVPGQIEDGLYFGGTSYGDSVNCGSAASLNNITQMTFSAWIRPDYLYANHRLFDKGARFARLSAGTEFVHEQHFTAADGLWATSGGSLTAGEWHHVAVVYDNSDTNNDAVLYVNGARSDPDDMLVSGVPDSDSLYSLLLGNSTNGSDTLHGVLDEVRLSKTLRTEGWIGTSYQNQSAPSYCVEIGTEEARGPSHVSLALSGSPFVETGGVATVAAVLTQAATNDVTVYLLLGGSAAAGTDYTCSTTNLLIAAGNTNGVVTLTGQNDGDPEGAESVIVTIDSLEGALIGDVTWVAGTLLDDDTAWAAGYAYRRAVVIDDEQVQGDSDLTNFPVFVNATDPDLRAFGFGGKVLTSNGWDVVFTAGDGTTPLDFEMEHYDPAVGQWLGWVRVPVLPYDEDTTLYLYYGNATVDSPQGLATGVWDSAFAAVWHFNEGAGTAVRDSTENANDGAVQNVNDATWGAADAVFGSSIRFSASPNDEDHVAVPDAAGLDLAVSNFTIEAWYRPYAAGDTERILLDKMETGAGWGISQGTPIAPERAALFRLETGGGGTGVATVAETGWVPGVGEIQREWWSSISGSSVADLTGHPDFPDNWSGYANLTAFDAPTEFDDSYGSRIRGWIHPPRNGAYTFWVSSDDNSELWLSTDEDRANRVKIAWEDASSGHNVWETGNEQSTSIWLEAGCRYYIEALHKEDSGNDNLSAGWQLPDSTLDRPISGQYLSTWTFSTTHWSYVAFVYDSGDAAWYYEGQTDRACTNLPAPLAGTAGLLLGMDESQTKPFYGAVDEVRLSHTSRQPGWIATCAANQAGPSGFYAVAAGEESEYPLVTLEISDTSFAETGGTANVTVWLSKPYASNVTVYLTFSGDAVGSADFSCPMTNVVVTAGNTTNVVTLTGLDDALNEEDEELVVRVDSAVNGLPGVPNEVGCTIEDDDRWPPGYQYRRKFTILGGAVSGTQDLVDFPVLINYTHTSLAHTGSGGNVQHIDGFDIILTGADALTQLDHEIERYINTTGEFVGWVRVPVLAHNTDTVLYMYYGNVSVSNSQENEEGVWDSHYRAVWHLAEDQAGTNTPGLYKDSTSNANHGDDFVMASGQMGQIGNGQQFSAGIDHIYCGTNSSLLPDTLTAEAWIKCSSQTFAPVLSFGAGRPTLLYEYNAAQPNIWMAASNYRYLSPGSPTPLYDNAWHHTVFTVAGSGQYDISNSFMHVDGQKQDIGTTVSSGGQEAKTLCYIGRYGTSYLSGFLDEVRLSDVVRSDGWIATSYTNQFSPSSFYTVGGAEQPPYPFVRLLVEDSGLTETGGVAEVIAQLSITTLSNVTVYLEFSGVAVTNEDYWVTGTSIFIAAGQVTNGITLTGLDDALTEGAETATVAIDYVENALRDEPDEVEVIIADDEDWLAGWTWRQLITISAGTVPTAVDLYDFPILINKTNFYMCHVDEGGYVEHPDGYDIVFTLADGLTRLDHELEWYDPGTGWIIAWVRLPVLAATADTTFYAYYGNSAITESQEDPAGTWGAPYRAVWHMGEDPSQSGTPVRDSTVLGNDGDPNANMTPDDLVPGQIGRALDFDGDDYISVADSPSLDITNEITISGWLNIKNSGDTTSMRLVSKKIDAAPNGYQFEYSPGNNRHDAYAAGVDYGSATAVDYVADTWRHFACVLQGSMAKIYVDGFDVTTDGTIDAFDQLNDTELVIGAQALSYGDALSGRLDEVHIAGVARSSDWIVTCFSNQASPSTFCSFGSKRSEYPFVHVTVGPWRLLESGDEATVVAGMNQTATNEVTVYLTLSGTAEVDADYTCATNIVIPAGWTEWATNLVVLDDGDAEGPETITLTLDSVANGVMEEGGTETQAVIMDDETPWLDGFWRRKAVVAGQNMVFGDADLTNFPMLVATAGDSDLAWTNWGGSVTDSNGYDICFTDATGTNRLDHEFERYLASSGQFSVWVRVPVLLRGAATPMYMYYGNPTVSNSLENPPGVWDEDYVGVWHLADTPTGLPGDIRDSTTNALHAQSVNMDAANVAQGKTIANALLFNGVDEHVETLVADSTNVLNDVTGALTVSAWLRRESDDTGFKTVVSRQRETGEGDAWWMGFEDDRMRFDVMNEGEPSETAEPVPSLTWYHVAGVWDGTDRSLYVDGVLRDADTCVTNVWPEDNPLLIGAERNFGSVSNWLHGRVDELRVSRVARSDGWIQTSHYNQNTPSSVFMSSTTEEAPVIVADFEVGAASGSESITFVPVTVTLNASPTNTVGVEFAMTGGTATPGGVDYNISGASPLTFNPGEWRKPIDISINNEVAIEPDETLILSLTSVANGVLGETTNHTYTILDDDGGWLPGFTARKALVISNSTVSYLSMDLMNFPVLVDVADTDLRSTGQGGDVRDAQGLDIVFTSGDGTNRLDFEVELYNETNGHFIGWVRLPAVNWNSDTTFYVYYGNGSITSSQQNAPGVWTNTYGGVWHLTEDPAGAAPQIWDASGTESTGTCVNMEAADSVAGMVNMALAFDGFDEYVDIATNASLRNLTTLTISAWIKPTSVTPGPYRIWGKGGTIRKMYVEGNRLKFYQGFDTADGNWETSSDSLIAGAWQHVAVSYDCTSYMNEPVLYVNGVMPGVSPIDLPSGTFLSDESMLTAISWWPSDVFDGQIDEVRVANVVRPAEWILTCYTNQLAPAAFYSVQGEELSDADGDGMADWWEEDNFGNTVRDGTGDFDADFQTDLEEYVVGTDPKAAGSFFRIVFFDVVDETNVVMRWLSAEDRLYAVIGADDVYTNALTVFTNGIPADPEGTNEWTDFDVVDPHTNRFYRVRTTYFDTVYTNRTEERGMFTQPRPSNAWYMVSVPVAYDGLDCENLNSNLGAQIARGLYAGASDTEADKVWVYTNGWQKYWLKQGAEPAWCDVFGTNVGVEVNAGTGVWVERTTNDAGGVKAVFTGMLRPDIPPLLVLTNWNMLGWPYPEPRHESDGWAFELGAGAVGTNDPALAPYFADMIQVYSNGQWRMFWLIDGLHPSYDGRWWDDTGRGSFPDYELAPGDAFYYLHRGESNFWWHPTRE
ncbi:MAG: DUF2341 domain-containing protein [Kiritimatiellae bacterium]|nr:DUF2341 domain-containing protein [Kiritimatiellia bacterium]